MPRTSAYDADANPNRAGQPRASWNHILVIDRNSNTSWGFDNAYGEEDVPVPAALEAERKLQLDGGTTD